MIAPDVLLKPRQIRREIERKQMRIETLRRFAEHLTSPLREVRVKSTPDPTRMQALLAEAADEEKQLPLLEAELEQALAAAAIMVSTLPDERLVHLIVTVMVVLCELFTVDLVLLHPELGIVPAVIMLGLAVLLGFYFWHYFFLENTVQRWYRIAEELREKRKNRI